uniref:Uncharacterized protein n=1 Tax=Glossina brevipalpis TaxID=37001 RepID=A0A1A9WBM7_9MUSC
MYSLTLHIDTIVRLSKSFYFVSVISAVFTYAYGIFRTEMLSTWGRAVVLSTWGRAEIVRTWGRAVLCLLVRCLIQFENTPFKSYVSFNCLSIILRKEVRIYYNKKIVLFQQDMSINSQNHHNATVSIVRSQQSSLIWFSRNPHVSSGTILANVFEIQVHSRASHSLAILSVTLITVVFFAIEEIEYIYSIKSSATVAILCENFWENKIEYKNIGWHMKISAQIYLKFDKKFLKNLLTNALVLIKLYQIGATIELSEEGMLHICAQLINHYSQQQQHYLTNVKRNRTSSTNVQSFASFSAAQT